MMNRLLCQGLYMSMATALLAGCGGSQPPISAPGDGLRLPLSSSDGANTSPRALRTCATTPPQYKWVFKGACQTFDVTWSGGHFSLGEYQGITVKGFIGRNTAKGTAQIALADAIDKNGDIERYKGKALRQYKVNGRTTYFYASAVNQSTQVIKMIIVKGEPVLQFTITNAKGFGDANRCGAALLIDKGGRYAWNAIPATGKVKRKTVTITQYAAPPGIELTPKIPLYFAVNCYKR